MRTLSWTSFAFLKNYTTSVSMYLVCSLVKTELLFQSYNIWVCAQQQREIRQSQGNQLLVVFILSTGNGELCCKKSSAPNTRYSLCFKLLSLTECCCYLKHSFLFFLLLQKVVCCIYTVAYSEVESSKSTSWAPDGIKIPL